MSIPHDQVHPDTLAAIAEDREKSAMRADLMRLRGIAQDRQVALQTRLDAICALQNPRFPDVTRESAALAERMIRRSQRQNGVS